MSVSLSVVKQVNLTQIIVSSKQDERLIRTLKTYGKLRKLLTSDIIGFCYAAQLLHDQSPRLCSTQGSMKFQLLIKTKMLKNKDISCFKTLRCCIILLINVKMPTIVTFNNCWHFKIYEQDKFHAQLRRA